MESNGNYDRWNQLRRHQCGCLVKARMIHLDSCQRFNPECTCPVTSAFLLSSACAHTVGMAKLCCAGVPNDGKLNWCTCYTIHDTDRCCHCLCSLFYSVCFLPIILGAIVSAALLFLALDLWTFLLWALTCGCCGTPLKFAYANELNSFSENDERVIACKESRSRRRDFNGRTTYGEWKNQVYYGRGRPCTCNLCLCFPCYQDLHGIDATSDDADDGVYKYYVPSFVDSGDEEGRAGMNRFYRVDKEEE